MTTPQLFALALQHHQAGRLDEAEAIYRRILIVQPDHADAVHHLGIVAHQKGRPDLAIKWIRHATALQPSNPGAHFNLGEAYSAAGRNDEAIASFRQALQLKPDYFEACLNLGRSLRQSGRIEEAIAANRRAIEMGPSQPGAYYNLGNSLWEKKEFAEAAAAYRRAIELKPDFFEAYNNLGNALRENGRLDEALAAYGRAVEFKPDWPEAHNNLGNSLREQGRFEEAMAEYGRAISLKPAYAEAHHNLGIVLAEQGRPEDAAAAYRHALQFRPDYPEAHNNLGVVLAKRGLLDEAVTAYRRALALRPDYLEARNNFAGALLGKGLLDEAISEFRAILRLDPRCAWVRSNLIYALHFHPESDAPGIAVEQRHWNRESGDPWKESWRPHGNDRNPGRRLRIGYVSPHFRDHVVGRNLWPLLRYHDDRLVEIVCYSDAVREDDITEKFRRRAGQWRRVVGLSDETLAETIRHDGVDILVDLTLHMDGNRLPMFARQPAPLQVSFAGYPASAGLAAIRHRISDRFLEADMADVPMEEREQVSLIESFWCYEPGEGGLVSNDLPAREKGYITFGSLNNFCKVNGPLLRLWARVMGRVENSRLVLLSGMGDHRPQTLEVLRGAGIEPHRVEFVELRPRRAYLEQHHRLDIVLDPFPYNGHTTSLDALWMGVPVISLVGARAVSRAGLSQLSQVGLPELAAFSEEEYVEIAARLAGDLPRLGELRSKLRARMEASVLMDGPRFARKVEAAYRTMWRQWCAENPVSPR